MGKVRLDTGKSSALQCSTGSIGSFDRILRQQSEIGIAKDAQESDPGLSTTGNPGNVGL
jgi:hypothetical protein